MKNNFPLAGILAGILWTLFSASAMLSAFILPVHIWALGSGGSMKLATGFGKFYFFILIAAALYHGLYRTKTIIFDLGFVKFQKPLGIFLILIFIIFAFLALLFTFLNSVSLCCAR